MNRNSNKEKACGQVLYCLDGPRSVLYEWRKDVLVLSYSLAQKKQRERGGLSIHFVIIIYYYAGRERHRHYYYPVQEGVHRPLQACRRGCGAREKRIPALSRALSDSLSPSDAIPFRPMQAKRIPHQPTRSLSLSLVLTELVRLERIRPTSR